MTIDIKSSYVLTLEASELRVIMRALLEQLDASTREEARDLQDKLFHARNRVAMGAYNNFLKMEEKASNTVPTPGNK